MYTYTDEDVPLPTCGQTWLTGWAFSSIGWAITHPVNMIEKVLFQWMMNCPVSASYIVLVWLPSLEKVGGFASTAEKQSTLVNYLLQQSALS